MEDWEWKQNYGNIFAPKGHIDDIAYNLPLPLPPPDLPKRGIIESFLKFAGIVTLALAIGGIGSVLGINNKENEFSRTARCIEEKCKDTSNPIYSEPESNISLWNLDGKGRYGEINIEAVTTYQNPIKVLWFNKDYVGEIKNRGWLMNEQTRKFTPEEKYRANRVANVQVFQKCLAESKPEN